MIKFSSAVLFVTNIQASREFYENILDQTITDDFGECIGFSGGFSIWQLEHARQVMGEIPGLASSKGNNFELYFESDDIDDIYQKLSNAKAKFAHDIIEQPWGQRVFRIYDPDGHLVELGEPMTVVIKRLLKEGMTVAETSARTSMPLEIVEKEAATLE